MQWESNFLFIVFSFVLFIDPFHNAVNDLVHGLNSKYGQEVLEMPIAIIPDIDEQRCIGCALCVEICTSLGPDVLRVKPVEGWKRGKAFVFYPERCISDGACIGVCPTKSIFWMRPMNYTAGQPVPLHKNGVFIKGWAEDAAL